MDKIPFTKAITRILLSVLLITGTTSLALVYYQSIRHKQKMDPSNQIVAIIQTTQQNEGLNTVYLEELLELSSDRPVNLYQFSTKEGEKKLLESPLIKAAKIRKIKPGMLHIDYEPRQPIAFINDYSNAAIDSKKKIFPFKPFFTPKRLPEIYLGLDENQKKEFSWGITLQDERLELAFNLLETASKSCCNDTASLTAIDVSKAFALSCGQRQIILTFEERLPKVIQGHPVTYLYSHILRLAPETYQQQLANYLVLRDYLRKNEKLPSDAPKGTTVRGQTFIIDLRLSELAFVSPEL